jgi:hypothetical protein
MVLTLLAAAYFVVAAVGIEDPALHASAEAVGDGRLWVLLTSALEPQGAYPLLQVAGAAGLAALLIARAGARGARVWWCCALAGHVLSAVAVYVVLGFDGAQPDYGISCVAGGTIGGLFVYSRGSRAALAAALAGTAVLLVNSSGRYGLEHPLSIAFGAAAALLVRS